MPGWAGNSCFFSRFYGGSEALFFFSCLLIRGSGLTLTLTRKQMAKSVQSRRRRHKTDYRSVRAGRNARVGFLRRKKTERHAMTWCPWRGPLIGSTTSASSDSYDGRDKPRPHTYYCRSAVSFCVLSCFNWQKAGCATGQGQFGGSVRRLCALIGCLGSSTG